MSALSLVLVVTCSSLRRNLRQASFLIHLHFKNRRAYKLPLSFLTLLCFLFSFTAHLKPSIPTAYIVRNHHSSLYPTTHRTQSATMPPKKDEGKTSSEFTINGFEPKETKLLAAGLVSMIGVDKVSFGNRYFSRDMRAADRTLV
jgi:hypothetical protein